MRAIRRRDTSAEMALRSALHRLGLRYRVEWPLAFDRRRRADVAFPRQRIALFVDGCFWHSCPRHGTVPRSNATFWSEKLRRNRDRDADTDRRLLEAGWTVIRVWEHEDPLTAATQVAAIVASAPDDRPPLTYRTDVR